MCGLKTLWEGEGSFHLLSVPGFFFGGGWGMVIP